MSSLNSRLNAFVRPSGENVHHPAWHDGLRRQAAGVVFAFPAAVVRWLKRRHTRQVLAALDEHRLRDIGLTRAELSKL